MSFYSDEKCIFLKNLLAIYKVVTETQSCWYLFKFEY